MGLGFTHRAWRHGLVGTQLYPRIVEVSDIWKDFLSGDGTLSSQGATGPRRWSEGQLSPRAGSISSGLSAISQWGWGVLGGIVLWGLRFRPRVVGVVEIWKDLRLRDGTISTPCAAGPRRGPEGQLFRRAGFMSSSHSETSPLSWSFHSVRGGIDPGDLRFVPELLEIYRFERIWEPGMGTYSPRVLQDLDVGPRGNSRRVLIP